MVLSEKPGDLTPKPKQGRRSLGKQDSGSPPSVTKAPKFNWANYMQLTFAVANPKKLHTLAWHRYEVYKSAKTVREAREKGASLKDLDTAYHTKALSAPDLAFLTTRGAIKDVNLDLPSKHEADSGSETVSLDDASKANCQGCGS